jgi:hypothetical protein
VKYLVACIVDDDSVDIDSQDCVAIRTANRAMWLDRLCDVNASMVPVRHIAVLLNVGSARCYCGQHYLICDFVMAWTGTIQLNVFAVVELSFLGQYSQC